MKSKLLAVSLSLGLSTLLGACANRHHEQNQSTGNYIPGLGEIMAQTATRHAKLWLAGQAQNWELATYEVDELREGFEDAGNYHPSHKHIAQSVPNLISTYMDQSLAEQEQAIKSKDMQAFNTSYDKLTAACNACHQSTEFGFNRVTRPTFNPFPNQAFETGK